jgi:hypothetical protein
MTTNETNLADAYGLAAITIRELRAEVEQLRTERDALLFAFMVQVGFAIVTNEEQSKDVTLAYELGRKRHTDKDKWRAAEAGEGNR